jgi:hypothetical protein
MLTARNEIVSMAYKIWITHLPVFDGIEEAKKRYRISDYATIPLSWDLVQDEDMEWSSIMM